MGLFPVGKLQETSVIAVLRSSLVELGTQPPAEDSGFGFEPRKPGYGGGSRFGFKVDVLIISEWREAARDQTLARARVCVSFKIFGVFLAGALRTRSAYSSCLRISEEAHHQT